MLYANGAITGLQEAWTFDEFYTAQAIEGLDKNGDGKYDREELAELAQVNIDGLKEFDYFTYAKLGGADRKFKPPENYWLEHTDKGILTLHFTLPLEQPVPADAAAFTFSVYDPSYFIAFDLAEGRPGQAREPARRQAAPRSCTSRPRTTERHARAQRRLLRRARRAAAASTLGGDAKTVTVNCAKS